MRAAAAAHVVLRVNFEKIDMARLCENFFLVLGLEPGADGICGQVRMDDSRRLMLVHVLFRVEAAPGGSRPASARSACQAGRLTGVSEPGPSGVCVTVQAPLSTSFQAFPW